MALWWWTIMFWAKDTSAALWVASTEAEAVDDVGAAEVVDDELVESPPQAARVRDRAAAPAATPRRLMLCMTVVLLVGLLAGCRRGEVGAATAAPRGSSA